jgi:transcriptional regulator with XRE-family HTH domain
MLQRLRTALDLTQGQVATAAAVPLSSLQNWELDRREPGLRTAVALARVLGVSAEILADTLPGGRARKINQPGGPTKRSVTKDFRTTRVLPRSRGERRNQPGDRSPQPLRREGN